LGFGGLAQKLVETKIGRVVAFYYFRINSLIEETYRYEMGVDFYEKLYREEFIAKSMRFLKFNQIKGDYLEFGCFGGITFGLAHKHKHIVGLDMRLYGFDSFQGLPMPKGVDTHAQWKESALAISRNELVSTLRRQGIEEAEYTLIPGFYDQSLKTHTPQKIGVKAAALVYIDCDLYESTVPVLAYVLPILQNGTIIAFDDFYCFNGDPDRGGQLALREFLQKHQEIQLVEYLNFGWHGKSFIVKRLTIDRQID